MGCDRQCWLFLYLHTQNVCKTNEFKSVYISQDSIGPGLYVTLWVPKCLFIFSRHCSLLELNAKLRILLTRIGQGPNIIYNQSVVEGH